MTVIVFEDACSECNETMDDEIKVEENSNNSHEDVEEDELERGQGSKQDEDLLFNAFDGNENGGKHLRTRSTFCMTFRISENKPLF